MYPSLTYLAMDKKEAVMNHVNIHQFEICLELHVQMGDNLFLGKIICVLIPATLSYFLSDSFNAYFHLQNDDATCLLFTFNERLPKIHAFFNKR